MAYKHYNNFCVILIGIIFIIGGAITEELWLILFGLLITFTATIFAFIGLQKFYQRKAKKDFIKGRQKKINLIKHCVSCGAKVGENQVYCPECGKLVLKIKDDDDKAKDSLIQDKIT